MADEILRDKRLQRKNKEVAFFFFPKFWWIIMPDFSGIFKRNILGVLIHISPEGLDQMCGCVAFNWNWWLEKCWVEIFKCEICRRHKSFGPLISMLPKWFIAKLKGKNWVNQKKILNIQPLKWLILRGYWKIWRQYWHFISNRWFERKIKTWTYWNCIEN